MINGIISGTGKIITIEECLQSNQNVPKPILETIMPNSRFSYDPNAYGVGEIISCLRKSYFDRVQGHAETLGNLHRSQVGSAIHDSFLKRYDMTEKQMTLGFDHNGVKLYIKGKFDGYDFKEKTLVEVKTKQDVSKISKPYDINILQLQCFATLAKTTLNLQVERLQVIYIDFNELKLFDIPFKDQLDFMKQRTVMLHEAITKRQEPREELSSICQSCSFNQKCSLPAYLIPKTLRR
ncbi:MAG TPA: hypothetical protein VEU72_03410 [Nitrosopumilaceae archaeon]|nr:hypothetical protein [Nitrosopumilaceae archaeon]